MLPFNEYIIFTFAALLGSIPFGLIIVKFSGLGNISQQGSGNIGATNVVRVAGKKLGALTFICDLLKGLIPLVIYKYFYPESYLGMAIVASIAILSHMFTPWLKFKGGKGVATGFGVLLGINPIIALATIFTWIVAYKSTKVSSIGALASYGLLPIYFFFFEPSKSKELLIFSIILSIVIWLKHHENIKRLLNGEENAFKKK